MIHKKTVVVRPVFHAEFKVDERVHDLVAAQNFANHVADVFLRFGHRFSVGDVTLNWSGELLETMVDGEAFETDVG